MASSYRHDGAKIRMVTVNKNKALAPSKLLPKEAIRYPPQNLLKTNPEEYYMKNKGINGEPIPIGLIRSPVVWKCEVIDGELSCPLCRRTLHQYNVEVYNTLPLNNRSMPCISCCLHLSPEGKDFDGREWESYLFKMTYYNGHLPQVSTDDNIPTRVNGTKNYMTLNQQEKEPTQNQGMDTQTEVSGDRKEVPIASERTVTQDMKGMSLEDPSPPIEAQRCKSFIKEHYIWLAGDEAKMISNRVDAKEMYDLYDKWCARNKFEPLTRTAFYYAIDVLVGPRVRSASYKYPGLRLKVTSQAPSI